MLKRLLAAVGILAGMAAYGAGPVVPAGQPAAAPTPAQPSKPDDEDDDAQAPAAPAKGPVKPANAPPPPAAAKPATPKEAAPAAEASAPSAKQLENAIEAVYHQKTTDHLFTLHVRPASPKPGQMVELELEVVRLLDPPDPVQGDRQPEDAELIAVLARSAHAGPRVVHPLKNPGDYGLHFTAGDPGIATVAFGRRSGKPGLEIKFPIGIGAPTPARPDDVILRSSAGRSPVHGVEGGDDLGHLMHQIARELYQLDSELADPRSGDAAASAKALSELAAKVSGKVPPDHANRRQEFDQLAQAFATSTAALASKAGEREKARTSVAQLELDSCIRCHAQFMWDVADDTTSWPSFTPATPSAPAPAAESEAP